MRDEEVVFRVLRHHLGHVADETLLRRASAAVARLPDIWEELPESFLAELGASISVQCEDICSLGAEVARGAELKVFRKRRG